MQLKLITFYYWYYSLLTPAVQLVPFKTHKYVSKDDWSTLGIEDIKRATNLRNLNGLAKNVILFVGDGMGPTTVTASRIYGATEEGYLSFERFPHIGVLKTYSADKLVADSASTATALFCGVKANQRTSGVDAAVTQDDCEAALQPAHQLASIISWAQAANKSTGFVTTTRVTHATPSALYAHTPQRNWECDGNVPPTAAAAHCKDIARQLVEDLPGRRINVILGGGRQCLQANASHSEWDPVDTWACQRRDRRDLIADWVAEKRARHVRHAYVDTVDGLERLHSTPAAVEYVLGIFANGHLRFNYTKPAHQPTLEQMTRSAVRLLRRGHAGHGFLLVVEGGLIDYAHHRGHARIALDESVEMARAIHTAVQLSNEEDTLIIVASDHAHSLVFTGYGGRDAPLSVLDVAGSSARDVANTPYTSLLYGTGGPNNYQFEADGGVGGRVRRRDPTLNDTGDYLYSQQAAVLTDEVAHGGTDVLVYAKGPMAHLFSSVHEQTYVAYVISYAANIGPLQRNSTTDDAANLVVGYMSTRLILLIQIVLLYITN